MQNVTLLTREIKPKNAAKTPIVAVMGLFDGVHVAHQALIMAAGNRAAELSGALLVYTFDRNPLEIASPARAPKPIMPIDAKIKAISAAAKRSGASKTYVLARPFNILFSQLQPERFIKSFKDEWNFAEIFVGFNYTFGASGKGTVGSLRAYGEKYGFNLNEMQPVKFENAVVSSTRIRRDITAGNVETAAAMLGKPFRVYGRFEGGMFVPKGNQVALGDGVYRAVIAGEPYELAVANGIMTMRGFTNTAFLAFDIARRENERMKN
ncbi:MAG: hypothetical protein LBD16_08615 [Oscillospiraceae bacterium]|nr:hypothetical protein [Oscillospiraceae bacterium]